MITYSVEVEGYNWDKGSCTYDIFFYYTYLA